MVSSGWEYGGFLAQHVLGSELDSPEQQKNQSPPKKKPFLCAPPEKAD